MKKITLWPFVFSLVCSPAQAANTLDFSARIQNEELAEEGVELLHCLSERLQLPWELSEGGSGPSSLRLEQKGNKLMGKLRHEGQTQEFFLLPGESLSRCETLAPAIKLAPATEEKPSDPFHEQLSLDAKPRRQWIWLGAALAVAAGGFFLWKSRQPDHRSLKMD